MTVSPRPGVAALSTLVLLFVGDTRATAGGAFAGETIVHVGDGGHEAWLIGQSQDVGYKYEYVAILWMDLWSWGGTYCVYQRFEDKYWPITPAEAARLLKRTEAEMQPPRQYRYPLGLFVFGPVVLLGAVGRVLTGRGERAAGGAVKPVTIDRPFDIGKPLATPHAVSAACPACGSGEYKSVQPAAMVSFTFDRVCTACKTRYTPPTPAWGRAVFGLIGAGAIAGGVAILYLAVTKGGAPARLYLAAAVAAVVGAGCLYKAATK